MSSCPLDIQTNIDFVDVIYISCFSEFNFMHNDLDSLLLIKDDASLHKRMLVACWRQAHGIKILK